MATNNEAAASGPPTSDGVYVVRLRDGSESIVERRAFDYYERGQPLGVVNCDIIAHRPHVPLVPAPPAPAVRCFKSGCSASFWAELPDRGAFFHPPTKYIAASGWNCRHPAWHTEITYAQLEAALASWPEAQQALRRMAGERELPEVSPDNYTLEGVPAPPAEGAESLKELTILRDYIGLAEGERAVAFERGRLIVDGPGGRRDARVLLNSVDLTALRTAGMPDDAEPGEWARQRIERLHEELSQCQKERTDYELERNALLEEVKPFRPMSIEDAERAFDEAEAVPLSESEVENAVRYATDPEYRAERCHDMYKRQHRISRGFKAEIDRLTRDLEEARRERDSRYASWRKLTEAIVAPRPRCRDCADSDGTCSTDGLPCDPTDLAIEVHRRLQQQLAAILRTLQRYQPGGSPPPGDEIVLANWILQSLQQQLAAEKERVTTSSIGKPIDDFSENA